MYNSTFAAINTFTVIILALISIILVVKYYFEIAHTYKKIRELYLQDI